MKKTGTHINKNFTIGFLCGTLFDPYQAGVFQSINTACREAGVNCIVFIGGSLKSPYYYQLQKNTIYNLVSSRNIDGIISLSGSLGNNISLYNLVKFLRQYKSIPLISIGVEIKGITSLLVDNTKGMENLLSHLIEDHKAKRIAFIRGSRGNPDAELRFSVYKQILKKYDIPFDPGLVAPGDFTHFFGTRAISLFLDKRKVTFDALVSSNDRMAFSAIEALAGRGIRVPEDVIVTGFDDIPKSRCLIPPLTTVRQPLFRIGKEAVQLLVNKFHGETLPEKKILETHLIIRRSCGCLEHSWKDSLYSVNDISSGKSSDCSTEPALISTIIDMTDNLGLSGVISVEELTRWMHTLVKAIRGGFEKGNFTELAGAFDRMLDEFLTRNQEMNFWNQIICFLCDYADSHYQSKQDREMVHTLRKNSMKLLSSIIERRKEHENIRIQEQSNELHRITQEFLSGFSLEKIKKAIIENFPRIGFRSSFISLYKIDENNLPEISNARLVVGCHNNKECITPGDVDYFPSSDLIPGTLKTISGIHSFIVISIHFKHEVLGFGVFEHTTDNILLYENFVFQLAGALQEIRILEQKEDQAKKLEQEVKVSVSALEKTTHQLNIERDERKKTEAALLVSREQALVTLRSIGDGVITTDTKGIITYLNPVAEELLGWENSNAVGKPLASVFNVVYRFSDKMVENPVDIALGQDRGLKISGSIILKNRDGHEYEIEESISPIRNFHNNVIGVVIIIRNVSETQRMTRELSYHRSHDQLTGLINRIRFEELVKDVLDELLKEPNEHCLCFLDIDSFRIINDACGHSAGDELIKRIATLLRGSVRQADILARLGGDQFGLLLIACPYTRAKELVEHILATVNGYTFIWKNTHYRIRMSIGLVYIDSYSANISRALTAANFACHVAKKKGGNQLYIYQADDEDSLKYQSEMHFIPYITKAIKEDRFCLYKQVIRPIGYGIPDNDHYEILLRMKDDEGNMISPGSFLQIAERYNLMPEIDRWVVEKLFSSYKIDYYETPDKAYAKYSINISGVTLNDEKFFHFIVDKLNQYKIPPYMICFEITETAAISNFSQVILFIKELKKIGCFFSLDDFGSGWASFNYLKVLPVDFLKIEGSFVREIARNPLDFVLVQTMNHIGHVIGLKTIAEYVENDLIIERLKKIGVDYAQGYGISKPEPFFD